MAIKTVFVSDDVLMQAAQDKGAASVEAKVLSALSRERRKDRQVHAFLVGDYWMTGPLPDARAEQVIIGVQELSAEDCHE
jgi:hypothetical protein